MKNLKFLKPNFYKYMIYIYFLKSVFILIKQLSSKKTFVRLCRKTFGTFCAYLPFPNIIKNNILNLTVTNS